MTEAQRARLSAIITKAANVKTARDTANAALTDLRARFEAISGADYWAEEASGHAFAAGDRVRYLGRWYVCVAAHTKTLLRLPTNAEYWEVAADA